MCIFLVPFGTQMPSLRGGLRLSRKQGLPMEHGDQAPDRYSEPARGIAEGELIPLFLLTISREGRGARQDSLPDGRSGSKTGTMNTAR